MDITASLFDTIYQIFRKIIVPGIIEEKRAPKSRG
jgi:hypothetical protein